jgi:hemerythrin
MATTESAQPSFDTVNELDRALRTGEGNSVTDPILGKPVDYARVHFAEEESLMETHNFPGLSTHRTEHEFFPHCFLQEHKAARPGVPVSLLFFVQAWFKKHLRKTDQQYCAFLKGGGVR